MVNAVRDRPDLRSTWMREPEETMGRPAIRPNDNLQSTRAKKVTSEPPKYRNDRPTVQTRSDTRSKVNADPTTNQLRAKAEGAVPPKGQGFPENGSVEDAKTYLKA